MAVMSTVYPIQSDKIIGQTPGGYPIGDRAISSKDLADIDKEIYCDGIISTSAGSGVYYQVASSGGMKLTVNPGKCYIRGRKASTPTETLITVDDADTLVNRIDRVVLRLDLSNEVRDVVVAIKKGDTSLTRTSSIWELGLADILVKKGTLSVSQSDITDLRFDSNVCGKAYNELMKVDTTGIFNQMQSIMSDQESKWQNQTTSQQTVWQKQTAEQQDIWQNLTDEQKSDYIVWKKQIDDWANLSALELAKSVGMNMDNLSAYPNTTYNCVFGGGGGINEKIVYNSGGVLAERATGFNADGSISYTLTVYNTDTSVLQRTTSTTEFKADGSISVSTINS